MNDLLRRLSNEGAFTALDVELALTLADLSGDASSDILLGVAAASRSTREGHVCADLTRLAARRISVEDDAELTSAAYPALAAWRDSLRASSLVSDGVRTSPLVLDAKDRLYLRRHWEDERAVATALRARAVRHVEPANRAASRALLERLFGPDERGTTDFQRMAATMAAISTLSIVSGGPGTGKTWTATKIVALAVADLLARGVAAPKVLLLAPTGKAAARLAESTTRAKRALDCPEALLEWIPERAETVHRALGRKHSPRTSFLEADRTVLADIVVVDEASMIDLSLMRQLLDALAPEARLVLLGDRLQLSSVEAGAVLADICGPAPGTRYSAELSERLERAFGLSLPAELVGPGGAPIDDAIVTLTRGHRFSQASSVGALARAIEQGDVDRVLDVFSSGDELVLLEPSRARAQHPRLASVMRDGFAPLASSRDAAEAFGRLDAFRVLSAHRKGPLGVEGLNRTIEELLTDAELLGPRAWFVRPVLVTKNDRDLGLFNGDVGVLFRVSAEGAPRVAFPGSSEGGVRALSPARLPPHEPAFAMTIHKSQGSEFDDVVVVLPDDDSPLLSRELLYTAVTRARRRVIVHAAKATVRAAVARTVARASGLGDALRTPTDPVTFSVTSIASRRRP
jgi:exodeoxyribonuclease V alpha subunit